MNSLAPRNTELMVSSTCLLHNHKLVALIKGLKSCCWIRVLTLMVIRELELALGMENKAYDENYYHLVPISFRFFNQVSLSSIFIFFPLLLPSNFLFNFQNMGFVFLRILHEHTKQNKICIFTFIYIYIYIKIKIKKPTQTSIEV